MSPEGRHIIEHLNAVAAERIRRARDPALGARVRALKAWQHARFQHTYADALASPRYRAAARFFLDDLYGPHDFTQRDAQFARIVPGLVRLFPHELVRTVLTLGELHSLSEQLDSATAALLETPQIDAGA
ncbi:MAG: FFLEELY motif protein, partial [Pseudomonadota bacterium]